jgi:hypothetical protein
MKPSLDQAFDANYTASCITIVEVPSANLYVPARPRLMVEFIPRRGRKQTVIFGEDGPTFLDALLTTPDVETACVVSGGAGYFIEPSDPRAWTIVECAPIRYAFAIRDERLLVFGDFTRLVAYERDPDASELRVRTRWTTPRLGWDKLEILDVTESEIRGRAWRAPDDQMIGFRVDVLSGSVEGGAYE